jgi:hypothetical protein
MSLAIYGVNRGSAGTKGKAADKHNKMSLAIYGVNRGSAGTKGKAADKHNKKQKRVHF